jgi:hypothetical protein
VGVGVVGTAIGTGHAKQFERGKTLVTPLVGITVNRRSI